MTYDQRCGIGLHYKIESLCAIFREKVADSSVRDYFPPSFISMFDKVEEEIEEIDEEEEYF